MNEDRRKVLLSGLFGAGWIGLRALATGLPAALFMNSKPAKADTPAACTAVKPQYIYLCTSGGGDPLNANVPGTYDDPGIYHTANATMAKTSMTLGSTNTSAAAPWAGLGSLLGRTCFFHHGTYTNSHGDAAKVNRLMGAVMRQEMLVSMLSKSLAPCLKTVQEQPVVLSNNLITYNGGVMPVLGPASLQAVLAAPTGPLANLQKIRDTHLDQLNALFKTTGNTAQKAILDQYALSQTEARSLSTQLLTDLNGIGNGTSRIDMNIAAAVLFKMNVSPVAVGSYSFGGDNHGDTGLNGEAAQTVASAAAITDFQTRLGTYGLADQVTMVFQNVFGRTLSMNAHSGNGDGRNHNANHHCTVMIGSGFKGSLIGGLRLQDNGNDYQAMGIDSATGAKNDTGDIPYEETLGSVGKTLGRAVGVAQTDLDTQITLGKVVPAALA